MRKFLNRPFIAVAAALGLVFLIILIRMYVFMIDGLSDSLMGREYQRKETFNFEGIVNNSTTPVKAVLIGPQWPERYNPTPPMIWTNVEITLGTFEALADTCFMQNDFNYASVYNKSDEFEDLIKLVKKYPHEVNPNGDKVDTMGVLLDDGGSTEMNSLGVFQSEISRYSLYSNDSKAVDDLIYDMATQPFQAIYEDVGRIQFKLTVVFDNGVEAMLKPMRVSREQQALPYQMHFAEYERHTSEIAAFHVDRVLGFNKALPVVGRKICMINELLRLAEPKLQKSFFISPKPDENLCFTGNCKKYCDSYHPICGNGTFLEASLMAVFPNVEGSELKVKPHPWAPSDSTSTKAMWETDTDYCDKVVELSTFSRGRLLLELIEMSIFDFLIGNIEQEYYLRFQVFGNDTFTPRYQHGRAFVRAHYDDLKILAPLLQCCKIKSSTLQTLLEIHNSDKPLSARMRESMANDPLAPILWEPHLKALDRRLTTVLQATRDCIRRYSADDVLVTKDTISFG